MKAKSIIIVLTVFLSSILSCKGQRKDSLYPPEKFSIIKGKLNSGKPFIGSINTSYKNYKKKEQYSWCLQIHIGLKLDKVTDQGLPLKSESDIANKFEDSLIAEISKVSTVHYIGHIYNDTFLDIYAYVDNPEKVNQYLQQQVNKKDVTRGFAYEMKQDASWETVEPFFK